MGCISLLSLISRQQGNEILLLLKHYDLWNGTTAPVARVVYGVARLCVCTQKKETQSATLHCLCAVLTSSLSLSCN